MKSRKKAQRHLKSDKRITGKRTSGKTGLPPGSLIHIGKIQTESVSAYLNQYNQDVLTRNQIEHPDDLVFKDGDVNNWIEICGLHETKVIESFGKLLKIPPLMLEDILNTEHRPKFEFQDGLLFLTLKSYSLNATKEIIREQVSFVMGQGFLVSFQESNLPLFEPIKLRLANSSGKIRSRNLDYLLYTLLDVIVDQYFEVIENIGDHLEELEDLMFDNPSQNLIEKNRSISKEIIALRKALIPALEAINKLNRHKPELIQEEIFRYFDDIDDHIVQILDYVDSYRELSNVLKENYLSNISFKMNQVMKLLTIITTIFIPLSFIAGIYGMNFRNMPELETEYGYYGVLTVMFLILAGMLIYFKRKKWM